MKCFKISHMLTVVGLSLLLSSFVSMAQADEIVLYVSHEGNDAWRGGSIDRPFASIQKARDAIRAMKKEDGLNEPVTVYIRGGLYELDEPIVFTLEDSGTRTCPITYTAYRDEKPVISGGRGIDVSWKKYEGEIMVATIPEVKQGTLNFMQLFVNGKRQTRARTPNLGEGFYYSEPPEEDIGRDAIKYRAGEFQNWKNLTDVQIVIHQSWNESRLIVSNLYEDERVITFTGPIGRRVSRNRYYIDNVLEGLDKQGEWYLDRHTGELYYWPDVDLESAEFRAPVLNELLRFEGDVEAKEHIQYVNIRGLTFCETSYRLPDEGIPVIRDVGDIWFPSAITLKGVSHCSFEDNIVRNVGTYGLDLTGDAIHVRGNEIYDTGSGGIVTRSYGKQRNVISYNNIHDCGLVFPSGVGVNIDDGGGLIANNLIHHTSHSGVYVRHHTTDYGQGPERSNQEQKLIIEYNEIYEVMHGSNDGAGIFVRDDHIVIRNNLIYDVWAVSGGIGSPGWGIYLGCETRNCLIENNVVYRASAGQMIWFLNKNNTFFNNIFVDGSRTQINYQNSGDAYHHNIRFLRNILSFSGSDTPLYSFGYSSGRSLPEESDYNLIFPAGGQDLVIRGLPGVETFEDWQELGFDQHSIVADPLFVDPENDDYTLRPDSPAFELGFKPIDLSRVGLRGRKLK